MFFTAADKRSLVVPGLAADKTYTVQVRAYRRVDADIDATGVIRSPVVTADPYQPVSEVAFDGNLTGTIEGRDALTVVVNLENIASDSVLSTTEKPSLILEYSRAVDELAKLDAKATSLGGLSAEQAAAAAAQTSLDNYLAALVPAWNNTTLHTPIDRAAFTAEWAAFYSAIADLSTAIQGTPGAPGADGADGANGSGNSFVQIGTTNYQIDGNNLSRIAGGFGDTGGFVVGEDFSPAMVVNYTIPATAPSGGGRHYIGLASLDDSDAAADASVMRAAFYLDNTGNRLWARMGTSNVAIIQEPPVAGSRLTLLHTGSRYIWFVNGIQVYNTAAPLADQGVYVRFKYLSQSAVPACGADNVSYFPVSATNLWGDMAGFGKPADNATANLPLTANTGCVVSANNLRMTVHNIGATDYAYSERFTGGVRARATLNENSGNNFIRLVRTGDGAVAEAQYQTGNNRILCVVPGGGSASISGLTPAVGDTWGIIYDGAFYHFLYNGAVQQSLAATDGDAEHEARYLVQYNSNAANEIFNMTGIETMPYSLNSFEGLGGLGLGRNDFETVNGVSAGFFGQGDLATKNEIQLDLQKGQTWQRVQFGASEVRFVGSLAERHAGSSSWASRVLGPKLTSSGFLTFKLKNLASRPIAGFNKNLAATSSIGYYDMIGITAINATTVQFQEYNGASVGSSSSNFTVTGNEVWHMFWSDQTVRVYANGVLVHTFTSVTETDLAPMMTGLNATASVQDMRCGPYDAKLEADILKLAGIESGADVTANSQRSIVPQFPVIEIKQGEAGNSGNRTVTHVAKKGTVTLTGGTWSLPSVNVTGATITINSSSGTVTLSGVAQSGAYTVRYTHTDGTPTDHAVNVTYTANVAAGVGNTATSITKTFSSTSFVSITNDMTIALPAGITSASLVASNILLEVPNALPAGVTQVEAKFQRESTPGTWVDVGAAESASPHPGVIDEGGFPSQIFGNLTCNRAATGLTAGSTQKFRLVARVSGGTTRTVTTFGSVTVGA